MMKQADAEELVKFWTEEMSYAGGTPLGECPSGQGHLLVSNGRGGLYCAYCPYGDR